MASALGSERDRVAHLSGENIVSSWRDPRIREREQALRFPSLHPRRREKGRIEPQGEKKAVNLVGKKKGNSYVFCFSGQSRRRVAS